MSSTNNLTLSSPIENLFNKNKLTKTAEKIVASGRTIIEDLLWILPLRIQPSPKLMPFTNVHENEIYRGSGKVINERSYPAYGRKGKGRMQLFNVNLVIQDDLSDELINLKWFNSYPNVRKKLKSLEHIEFYGQVSEYKGQLSIINPKLIEGEKVFEENSYLIEYPTINGTSGTHLKKIINKIPESIWENIDEDIPKEFIEQKEMLSLSDSFKLIHGKIETDHWTKDKYQQAKERLVYHEFLLDQFKVLARRNLLKGKINSPLKPINVIDIQKLLPYELTDDQKSVLNEVKLDLESSVPMMRMIQGDVGSGKTTIALGAAFFTFKNNQQVAVMAPTESLARQHYLTFKDFFKDIKINIQLLLGSHKPNEKKIIYSELKEGVINIIIGTHSLFQEKVEFNNLTLAVIDEQHKFGVEQRLKLLRKGDNPNCLIMTATPIPRTLRLTQYGDLDISIIKQMPRGRKGIKTRIVEEENYEKFLSFLKTRMSMKEQVYVVVPAIEESATLDIKNVGDIFNKFKNLYPEYNISFLHGQLKSEEKDSVLTDFKNGKLDLIVSTSVIEVGIDNPNATVMAIYDPNRFGLSSLHQLRGRVGRSDKPGFCFLVTETKFNDEVMERLIIMEETTDGFKISEEDLKFRGEGDLFGVMQSGTYTQKNIANIFEHSDILHTVCKDIEILKEDYPEYITDKVKKYESDDKITSTI